MHLNSKYSEVPKSIELDTMELTTDEMFEVVVDVRNAGNQDIEPAHFERSLTLRFGEQARVVFAEVIEEEPYGIGASVEMHPDRVVLAPVLLNTGDLVSLYLTVYRYNDIQVDGRIVGVKRVQRSSMWKKLKRGALLDSVGMLVAIGLLVVTDFFPRILPSGVDAALLGVLVAGLVLAARGGFGSTRDYRKLQRREAALKYKARLMEESVAQAAHFQQNARAKESEGHRDEAEGEVDDAR